MSKRFTVAKISKGGANFEILVDPDVALRVKMGENLPASKFLVYEEVYRDSKKGIRANTSELTKTFGTTDIQDIALRILREGELQITSDQRRRLIEEKKKQIIDFLSKHATDPRTNMPIPPQRLELSLEEAGVSIDPFVDAKKQVPKILEKLRMVIPIKVGLNIFLLRVPSDSQPTLYRHLKSLGKILKEEWGQDGWWRCELEAPAGMITDLVDLVNKYTSGRGEVKPRGEAR
ncbi:MAG: ribosome assembly factor SBDS [Nitrososphaerota archaeon]|nr:ribosome assembly factor SBDS [Candidatus Calditenuaceae archaeon]MDW8072765.1 ribosome assembly factor SBDS [Nitrososphaerota archaeon]